MERPTDQEMINTEKTVCYRFREEDACHTTQGHMRKHRGWSVGSWRGGKTRARGFILVSMGRKGRGRVGRFRIG